METDDTLGLTVGIVTAFVSHNRLPPAELPGLIAAVQAALTGLDQPTVPMEDEAEPWTSRGICVEQT